MKLSPILEMLVLILILGGGVGAFLYVRPQTGMQFIVGVITAISYVLWGVIHHALKKDLHIKIVIEYVLMASIALILLATVLD